MVPPNTTSPAHSAHRLTRKPIREPPPPYSITPLGVPHHEDDPNTDETTPLLQDPAYTNVVIVGSQPSSPQRIRRPTRMRRQESHSESTTNQRGAPPVDPAVPPPPALTPIFLSSSAFSQLSLGQRLAWYFRPLAKKKYWLSVFHLAIVNFPFALVAWVCLFVGTLVGTTLLLTLPFGVLVWWATLMGARAFTRAELALQLTFHLSTDQDISLPGSVSGISHRSFASFNASHSPLVSVLQLEAGTGGHQAAEDAPPAYEQSFLQRTYTMFLDPVSYQPLFYFIVIKGATTLVMTPLILAIVPVSIALVFPAPFVLKLVRRVGLWQAELAIEALS